MIGDRKSIYHSTLTRAGDVRVRVKSDILTSKFKKEGEPGHYYVIIEHDGTEQTYTIENEACAAPFRGQKGNDITIRAEGAREDATVCVVNSDGTAKPAVAPPQRSVAPAALGQPVNATQAYMTGLNKAMNAAYLNYRAVQRLSEQLKIEGIELGPEQGQAIASTAFITLDRLGMVQALPEQPLWSAERQLEEKPEGEEPW